MSWESDCKEETKMDSQMCLTLKDLRTYQIAIKLSKLMMPNKQHHQNLIITIAVVIET